MSSATDIAGLRYALEPLVSPQALEAAWTDLAARADCPFYLTWDWIGTWLEKTPGLAPLLLSVRDGETLVGLALFQPARLRRRFITSRALLLHQTGDPYTDIITIEFNDVLADRACAQRVRQGLIPFLKRAKLPGAPFAAWDELHFAVVTDTIASRARAAGLMVLELAHKTAWLVDLEAVRRSGKPYLETLSSNTRYQIRRAMRLYEENGPLTATRAGSVQEAMAWFEDFKRLHQRTWVARGKPGGFSNAYFEDFHRTLITRCIARGTVELVRVAAGDLLIGVVYNFIHRGHVYCYQTGLNYGGDAKYKPGLVSHYLCLERHLRDGARVYDFMAGDNRYKRSLGERAPDMMHFALQRRTPRMLLETGLRAVKSLLRR